MLRVTWGRSVTFAHSSEGRGRAVIGTLERWLPHRHKHIQILFCALLQYCGKWDSYFFLFRVIPTTVSEIIRPTATGSYKRVSLILQLSRFHPTKSHLQTNVYRSCLFLREVFSLVRDCLNWAIPVTPRDELDCFCYSSVSFWRTVCHSDVQFVILTHSLRGSWRTRSSWTRRKRDQMNFLEPS